MHSSYKSRRRRKAAFKLVAFLAAMLFLAPLVGYIYGRIILPEMGLTAPDYGTWFAGSLVIVVFYVVLYWLKSALLDEN